MLGTLTTTDTDGHWYVTRKSFIENDQCIKVMVESKETVLQEKVALENIQDGSDWDTDNLLG